MSGEASHYVVTAHPPGAVLLSVTCNFLSPDIKNVVIAKSRRLEVRQYSPESTDASPFPVVLTLPIHGRITSMLSIPSDADGRDCLFLTTDRLRYAVIQFVDGKCRTMTSGSLKGISRSNTVGPLVSFSGECVALHLYDGLLTILPNKDNGGFLGEPYHVRLEERNLLDIAFIGNQNELCLLHQDSRGAQHVVVYSLDLKRKVLQEKWKKSRVDGGSSMLIGRGDSSVVVVGQRQITLLAPGVSKVVPMPPGIMTASTQLSSFQTLLSDEFGNLHLLTFPTSLQLETLGQCTIVASSLAVVHDSLIFVGSQFGDSQLVSIEQSPPVVLEEYMNLGPIVDLDRVVGQESVVTCSGTSIQGSLRLVCNGIGLQECARVEMEGIQNMWSVAGQKLVQSFVGETRVLGVVATEMEDDDEEEATLEEVVLPGLDSTASSLYVGNVPQGMLQITESQVRLISTTECTATWLAPTRITVASGNEAGQVVVALQGGTLVYLRVKDAKTIEQVATTTLEREVSCVDLRPFAAESNDMDDGTSRMVAVGLWDDFSVRLLSLDAADLQQVVQINLSEEDDDPVEGGATRNNMMARSLCLVTLNSPSGSSVNMLFVGLGDGTLISFAIIHDGGSVSVKSKKQVSLGTQRINLIPLGGRCILATGDRPTVIYLAGGGGGATVNYSNPKLCYSTVNLSTSGEEDDVVDNRPPAQQSIAIHAATPFCSPQLFDTTSGSKQYSLCVSDDSNLRLGIIDDIQKLHVTTCRLGMAPRRVVHCFQDRLFAVGCIESGLKQGNENDMNMGNCVRFLDDTTFDDIGRIDLEPFEMILSMVYASIPVAVPETIDTTMGDTDAEAAADSTKSYLLVGTGYALPGEDEPTRGRILVLSCSKGDTEGNSARSIKHVTELQVRGGVYAMCQFYNNTVLATVNSKTQVCHLSKDDNGSLQLSFEGIGHHGHILSLFVKSNMGRAKSVAPTPEDPMLVDDVSAKKKASDGKDASTEQLAIVGDLMRSISLVQYYPEHKALEEIARDFNANWTTAIEMLTDEIYLGAENWNNLFVLRRNTKAQSEEVRCRLDTIGEFHLGEMCNKFMSGSLVSIPHSASTASSSGRRKVGLRLASPKKKAASAPAFRPTVTIGSQTLFATVDGTLGSILGLDARTTAFFKCLERAMAKTIDPVGDFGHAEFRAFDADRRVHPCHGFVDGDLVESFLDLDRPSMESVVKEMNRDGKWDVDAYNVGTEGDKDDDEGDKTAENHTDLVVEDVLAMVEEMSMFH